MIDLRDNKLPAKLVGDRLGGCFGECEMEIAVRRIVDLAVKRDTWRLKLTGPMFSDSPAGYALDRFHDLIEHGWLIRGDGDFYEVHSDMIKRLMKERPEAFK